MSARKMFEELGFKFNEDNYSYSHTYHFKTIQFNLDLKSYTTTQRTLSSSSVPCRIDMKLNAAIQKQIKELNWNNNLKAIIKNLLK